MSPRAKKQRNCGCKFMGKAFKPMGIPMTEIEKIPLYADELKALKPSAADGLKLDEAGE